MESRRKALEELQEVGRREVDAGREELRLAAEGLEKEKGDIKAAWKVCSSSTQSSGVRRVCRFHATLVGGSSSWGHRSSLAMKKVRRRCSCIGIGCLFGSSQVGE